MTWYPLPSPRRLVLAIVHAFLGHPTDDYRENITMGTAWCDGCGAALDLEESP